MVSLKLEDIVDGGNRWVKGVTAPDLGKSLRVKLVTTPGGLREQMM